MRKILILMATVSLAWHSDAQMNQYFFNRESGTLMDVENYSGAQITNHAVQDDIIQDAKIPVPFTFKLGNMQVDTLGIAENGYLFISSLSAFAVSSPWPISTQQPSQVKGIISALGVDLHPVNTATQKTTIKSALVGTAPLRTLIVEWKHTSTIDALNDGNPDDINFQIKLYETTGRIELAYGNFTLNPNTSVQAEIGIKGSNFNDYANRSVTASDWSTSIAGNSQMARVPLNSNSKPQYGTLYVWEVIPGTAVSDINADAAIVLYPNPAHEHLYISDKNNSIKSCSYLITDISGRTVTKGTVSSNSISIAGLAEGSYLLQIKGDGVKVVQRFVKH